MKIRFSIERKLFVFFALLGGMLGNVVAEPPASELQRWAIDEDCEEFNIEMNVAISEHLPPIAVWKGYKEGVDRVSMRRLDLEGGENGAVEVISHEAKVIGGLSAASTIGWLKKSRFSSSCFSWSEMADDGNWRVAKCTILASSDGIVDREIQHILGIQADAENSLLATPIQILQAEQKSRIDVLGTLAWSRSGAVSSIPGKRFRPNVAGVWVFWDEYLENGDRRIFAKSLEANDTDKIISVSPPEPGTRCITPVAIESESEGICVAWVKLTDAVGGEGVIDMFHTAHAARHVDGKFEMVTDENGSDEAAMFLSGLLPDLRPGKGYPSGYSGRRRHPMLLESGDGIWLLWERKSAHSGGGSKTAGQLLGRKMQKGKWVTDTLLLHEGLIDYRLAKPERTLSETSHAYIIGSAIPHSWKRPSYLVKIDLTKAQPIELDDWSDQFKPIKLPLPDEPPRYVTEGGDGKKYQLFWGDLHCHSGLTGDAEGEPDEIVLYARDRAKLDVMVMQDNDDVHGRPLTEGEYHLGQTYSRWITEPGKFVALPGYEWTQRTSKKGVPDPYLSAFEQKIPGGFPNHRTVIYPMKGGPIVRYFEVRQDFDKMAEVVAANDGILHSQHPAFQLSDHAIETNLEVTACWGIYIRKVPALFHGELDKGRRMGFIGTSDSHRRNPGLCGGLTGIYAEELTPEAIMDALKEHRVFATNGSKIVVDSRADRQLSDQVVSSADGSVKLSLSLIGTTPITGVRLIGTGGKTVASFPGNGTQQLNIEKTLSNLPRGDHWFYWAIEQEGTSKQYSGNISVGQGNLAWSSPHFVEVK